MLSYHGALYAVRPAGFLKGFPFEIQPSIDSLLKVGQINKNQM